MRWFLGILGLSPDWVDTVVLTDGVYNAVDDDTFVVMFNSGVVDGIVVRESAGCSGL